MSLPTRNNIVCDVKQFAAATVGGVFGAGCAMASNWGICCAGASAIKSPCIDIFNKIFNNSVTQEFVKEGCTKVVEKANNVCAESAVGSVFLTILFFTVCAGTTAYVTDQFRRLSSEGQYRSL